MGALVLYGIVLFLTSIPTYATARSVEPIPIYQNVKGIKVDLDLAWESDVLKGQKAHGVNMLTLRKQLEEMIVNTIRAEVDRRHKSLLVFTEVSDEYKSNLYDVIGASVHLRIYGKNNRKLGLSENIAVLEVLLTRWGQQPEPRTTFNYPVPFAFSDDIEVFKRHFRVLLSERFKQIVTSVLCHQENRELRPKECFVNK